MDLGDLGDLEVRVDFVVQVVQEDLVVLQANRVLEVNQGELWVREALAALEGLVDLVGLVDQMDQLLLGGLGNLVVKVVRVDLEALVDLEDPVDLGDQTDHCHQVVPADLEGRVDLVVQEGLMDLHHLVALVNLVGLEGLEVLVDLVVRGDLVDLEGLEDREVLVYLVNLVHQEQQVRKGRAVKCPLPIMLPIMPQNFVKIFILLLQN